MNQEKYSVQGSQQRDPDPQPYSHHGHEQMHHPHFQTLSHPQGQHFVHHHYHHHFHHMMRDQDTTQR
ncbi:hypothetical protein [Paenibacillus terrigena]|uniref:hypothetical protein n=1 Tax=Paenibacillus terrigena TaxID=369333 RepID=UPI0028D264CE|nr:hypothetical protein [Paenibacillus terrigena]